MKIVPVIDILDGVAVHAVKGRRKNYKPLKSMLSKSANPLDVATAFQKLGFKEIYVADLNAITGNYDNFSVLERIAQATELQLMVDAGVNDIKKAKELIQHGASKVIIGTETLTSIGFIDEAIQALGTQRVILSLDLKRGHLLSGETGFGWTGHIELYPVHTGLLHVARQCLPFLSCGSSDTS